jgi:hypothetical protein
MADWTNIDPNTLLPGEPWTSAKALAAFENPVAIGEGAPGAPRIYLPALERLIPGDSIRSRNDDEITADGFTPGYGFSFVQIGTIRVSFEHRADVGVGVARVRRTRNGITSTIASFDNSASYVARTVDVPVRPGDSVFNDNTATSGVNAYLRNSRFSVDSGNLWPGNSAKLEGNNV